ncbi:MAG: hypothetical protein KY476_01650 [Planctomycetes bacterium]|nr:hypothetical protein [Planctomycetota bacterium]
MIKPAPAGISREGLDASFEAEERRKSNLLLQARMLLDQGDENAAALRFAEAAAIEERLSDICAEKGLAEKASVHRFSAASCWAAAGNFHDALLQCELLLAQPDIPDRLRGAVAAYSDTIRERRAEWYANLERQNLEAGVAP